MRAPLGGRRIAVTRAKEQASALAEQLEALGAEVVRLPTIAIEPPLSWEPLDMALTHLARFDWLLVTSANSARALGERWAALSLPQPKPGKPRVAVIGPATASAMQEAGFAVDRQPGTAVGEALAEALLPDAWGARMLLLRGEKGRDVLPETLRAAGAEVVIAPTHRTVAPPAQTAQAAQLLPTVDAITFTSSSSAANLLQLLAAAGLAWPEGLRAVSFGPVTSATLREGGVEPAGEAEQHTLPGLLDAVLRCFATARG